METIINEIYYYNQLIDYLNLFDIDFIISNIII